MANQGARSISQGGQPQAGQVVSETPPDEATASTDDGSTDDESKSDESTEGGMGVYTKGTLAVENGAQGTDEVAPIDDKYPMSNGPVEDLESQPNGQVHDANGDPVWVKGGESSDPTQGLKTSSFERRGAVPKSERGDVPSPGRTYSDMEIRDAAQREQDRLAEDAEKTEQINALRAKNRAEYDASEQGAVRRETDQREQDVRGSTPTPGNTPGDPLKGPSS